MLTNTSGTAGSYVVAFTGTAGKLTLSWNAGATTCFFDLPNASYDTLSELVTKIASGPPSGGSSPVGNWTASVVPGVSSSTASNLLDAIGSTAISTGTSAILTYSNTASGTVAALVDTLIDEVSAAIERYCDRTFASASFDERYSGNNGAALVLKNAPVTAISAVSYFDNAGTETTLAATEYRYDSGSGVLYRLGSSLVSSPTGYAADAIGGFGNSFDTGYVVGGPARFRVDSPSWWYGFNNWRVQYTGGYSSTPADIQNVATEMVVTLYMDRRQSRRGSSRRVGGDSVSYRTPDEMVRYYDSVLSQYRRMVV